MHRLFVGIVLVSLVLIQPVFADLGPGPDKPVIQINLLNGKDKYTGAANVTYLCSKATERGKSEGAVKPGDLALECSEGKCTNTNWYYKFNPCFYSSGRFEVVANGEKVVTSEASFESGGFYTLEIDIQTGKINRSDSLNVPCITSFMGILLLSLFVFSRK